MDLTVTTERFSSGNLSWLGSKHGTDAARTVTISRAALTAATHYPDGYLKSGTPLAIVAGKAVPFNASGSDGSEVLAGFLFTDQRVKAGGGDIVAPLLDHGRIVLSKLPSPVTADAATTGQFIFV
ncbi:potassium transporter [Mycobacteroides abscessus]|uniref:hypothetical protein n=1 Tax=Mycobacteroides TaxID=670516 RepID=UPI00078BCC93|nr:MULTISPECIES: hypothetical protein [Mycobacteroides]QSM04162.1 head decoration protein [Mycobacterium phage prophiGD51-2]AMU55751.1 potassium transporter [Mycobacteroides abscessus]MBE5436492.1 hypothetical protein [Mycobacteroides abscessus]MBN7447578.1 potassium transporter [Mycobacteroides abscessus subsp. abscessus]MDM1901651.1 potassium transporter [Mycobacteroides abscessus]